MPTGLQRALVWSCCILLGLSVAGCSDGRLPTYSVNGRVVFPDGSPIHVGTVELRSLEHAVQARGEVDHDGRFTLTTYREGDGAVAGMHACVVVQFVVTEELRNYRPSAKGVVHPKFAAYSTSGLQCEVAAQESNEVTIVVEGITDAAANRLAPHDHHKQDDSEEQDDNQD